MEPLSIPKIEAIALYSYRHMNRIFQALESETIGQYWKRRRLEKAGEYLRFSKTPVSDISDALGFNDVATFSKAFRNWFDCSPTEFRTNLSFIPSSNKGIKTDWVTLPPLPFELIDMEAFDYVAVEWKGPYDSPQIELEWNRFIDVLRTVQLLPKEPLFFAEILDDDEITDAFHCRYRMAMILDCPRSLKNDGPLKPFYHPNRKYCKFIHHGSHQSCGQTYLQIYAQWLTHVQKELLDAPTLEFYVNDDGLTAPEDLVTEIYIPVK